MDNTNLFLTNNLYEDFALAPLENIYQDFLNNHFTISGILSALQKFNLLCEDEVSYYARSQFKNLPNKDLISLIQKRCIHHAKKEQDIKESLGENGGFIKLGNGSRVEGSIKIGGQQPNYIIDSTSPTILNFLSSIEHLKALSTFNKIKEFGNFLRSIISKTEYDYKPYQDLMKEYRDKNLEIPLSEYLKKGVGTCREMSMLTTLGLCHLGLDANYYYAKVQTTQIGAESIVEDHAVSLVRMPGDEVIVVDNYFRAFNLYPLDMVLSGVSGRGGLMYDSLNTAPSIKAQILSSRLYPTARHLPKK